MSKNKSTRRNFLQVLGLSAGASVVSVTALGSMINATEIKKLNPKQQEFMIRYGKWMNDFIEAVRIKKTDPAIIKIIRREQHWQKFLKHLNLNFLNLCKTKPSDWYIRHQVNG